MSDKYPEHTKLRAVHDQVMAVRAFLSEYLPKQRYELCIDNGAGLTAVARPLREMIADHFGIDLARIEEEKRAMLGEIRANASTGPDYFTSTHVPIDHIDTTK